MQQDVEGPYPLVRTYAKSWDCEISNSDVLCSASASFKTTNLKLNPESPAYKNFLKSRACLSAAEGTQIKLKLVETGNVKGLGVVIQEDVAQYQFITKYEGILRTEQEAMIEETKSTENHKCYMFFFKHKGKGYCVDATDETSCTGLARYINHSRKFANVYVKKVIDTNGKPSLLFLAKNNICSGSELLYDYGDRENAKAFPWLLE